MVNVYDMYLASSYMPSNFILSSGNDNFDEFLGDGLHSGDLIEFSGPISTGKTQICTLFTLNAVLYNIDDINELISLSQLSRVWYLDTTLGFSPQRLIQIFQSKYNLDDDKIMFYSDMILKSITYLPIYDCFSLLNILYHLNKQLSSKYEIDNSQIPDENTKDLKLIVIDNLGLILYPIIGKNSSGHNILVEISRLIKMIAIKHHIIFLTTNYAVIEENKSDIKPGLGKSWSYMPSVQILLKEKEEENQFTATVIKSNRSRIYQSIDYILSSNGIEFL